MFKVDASAFEHMVLDGKAARKQVKRRNQLLEDQEVATQILQGTLRKFCNLCTHYNIDAMDAHSLPLAILLSSKAKNRRDLAQQYADWFNLDVQMDEGGDAAREAMQTVADWCTVLQYLHLDGSARYEPTSPQHKMRQALLAVGIAVGDKTPDALDRLIVHVAVRDTPTPRMIEGFFLRVFPHEKDISFKSMKLATLIWDTVYDEQTFHDTLLQICIQSSRSEQWTHDITKTVQDQVYMQTTLPGENVKTDRPRLRILARQVHNSPAAHPRSSFRSWCSLCGFPASTSTQLQRILYFVRAQCNAVPTHLYEHLYTDDVLARSSQLSIETVDVDAMKPIIASIRVYRNNIKDLIDFRAQCLLGLPLQTRNKLSLAQVLQLYTSMYQHDSVWEECWKAVVPVMNHTISTSRARFCGKHPFDVEAILQNIIACHLGVASFDAPRPSNATDALDKQIV